MVKKSFVVLVMVACLCAFSGQARAAQRLPVGTISITFDDGTFDWDMLLAIWGMRGKLIPGTFYIATDWVGDNDGHLFWDTLRIINNDWGWEIGNHTAGHEDPDLISIDEFTQQVKLADQALCQHGILQATSFAIPRGKCYKLVGNQVILNPDKLAALNSTGFIKTSRQAYRGDNQDEFNRIDTFNPMAIKVFSWKGYTPESKLIALLDQASAEGYGLYLVVHMPRSHPDTSDNDQIDLAMFLRVCSHIKDLADKGKILPKTVSQAAGIMIYYQNLSN